MLKPDEMNRILGNRQSKKISNWLTLYYEDGEYNLGDGDHRVYYDTNKNAWVFSNNAWYNPEILSALLIPHIITNKEFMTSRGHRDCSAITRPLVPNKDGFYSFATEIIDGIEQGTVYPKKIDPNLVGAISKKLTPVLDSAVTLAHVMEDEEVSSHPLGKDDPHFVLNPDYTVDFYEAPIARWIRQRIQRGENFANIRAKARRDIMSILKGRLPAEVEIKIPV